jgi:hypothetical protein
VPPLSLFLYNDTQLTLSLAFSLEMVLSHFVPSDSVAQDFITFMFLSRRQLSADVHLLLFQFLSDHLGNPLCTQLSVFKIGIYHLHSFMWNGNFVCYCLLRNVKILLDHFFNRIAMSIIGCCSWFLAMLLLVQAGMSEVCIMCSPVLNTDVCTTIPVNNFHLSMNVSQWNIFCSKKIQSQHAVFSTLTLSPYTAPFSWL